MKKSNRYERLKDRDWSGYLIMLCIFMFASVMLHSMLQDFNKHDIIRDNPECILNLKQDYCAIYNMTYGSKVMMTGLLSKNAQTIEICYDDVNEFRLYRSDIDVYACEKKNCAVKYDYDLTSVSSTYKIKTENEICETTPEIFPKVIYIKNYREKALMVYILNETDVAVKTYGNKNLFITAMLHEDYSAFYDEYINPVYTMPYSGLQLLYNQSNMKSSLKIIIYSYNESLEEYVEILTDTIPCNKLAIFDMDAIEDSQTQYISMK